jgi:hypothetical protein
VLARRVLESSNSTETCDEIGKIGFSTPSRCSLNLNPKPVRLSLPRRSPLEHPSAVLDTRAVVAEFGSLLSRDLLPVFFFWSVEFRF